MVWIFFWIVAGSINGLCFRFFWVDVGCGFFGLIVEWVVKKIKKFKKKSFVLMQVQSMLWIFGA